MKRAAIIAGLMVTESGAFLEFSFGDCHIFLNKTQVEELKSVLPGYVSTYASKNELSIVEPEVADELPTD